MGVTSLVLGIISTVIGVFIPAFGWIAAILGIVGIILASVARKNGQRGAATAGLVLCIIGTVLGLLFYIACAACVAAATTAAGL